jgi:hypothetical protein
MRARLSIQWTKVYWATVARQVVHKQPALDMLTRYRVRACHPKNQMSCTARLNRGRRKVFVYCLSEKQHQIAAIRLKIRWNSRNILEVWWFTG